MGRISRQRMPGLEGPPIAMKTVYALFFVAGVLALAAPRPASACSCLPPGSPLVERDRADAVFAGRVRNVTQLDDRYLVEIDVSESWKGDASRRVMLFTGLHSAACGYYFEEGKSYLIYGYVSEGYGLGTNICSRTSPLEDAGEDLQAFGLGEKFSGGICGGPDGLAAMQGLFLVAIAGIFGRRRRQSSMT